MKVKIKNIKNRLSSAAIGAALILATGCSLPSTIKLRQENKTVPSGYSGASKDTVNSGMIQWKNFFTDPYLHALIDTALQNNQEYNIMMQEINIAQSEAKARKGEYLPFLNIGGSAGVEKAGTYTRNGAVERNLELNPGKENPEPLPDFMIGANASWELDIWKKLRNTKKSAVLKYLATVEGRNFMRTNLVAEIASSYYELMAFDNQLDILKQNIEIQQNALEIVKMQKEAAKTTELAVRKFEAEVLKNQAHQYYIMQQITEAENKINFLVGRFPQPVPRNSQAFVNLLPDSIHGGIPSQLLSNRPDIKQAELELAAAKLDVKAARANFYPSLRITAGIGYQAFNPQFILKSPESMIYSAAGELVAPLINRNAIKAYYYSASSKQLQNVYNYERTILRAHIEVANQLSNISNLEKSYAFKEKQVQALNESINISTRLFKSARADYMEVLLTQRDALESRFELIETKMQQLNARVNMYQALGGGWN
ncbi:MAG: efflux transporter outer membrane subunit [Bacteroidota bacterium]